MTPLLSVLASCAILAAAAPAELTGRLDGPAVKVDASRRYLFGLRWHETLLRDVFFRDVAASFATPGISAELGLVIVGTGEGRAQARRLQDGRHVWTYTHGAPFESAVTMARLTGRELALIGSRDGKLLALDAATGSLVWAAEVGGDVRAPLALARDLLVAATANNRLCGIELGTGAVAWTAGRPPRSSVTLLGHAQPLIAGDTVYASFSDGFVGAYALDSGDERWTRPLSELGGGFVDADADPVLSGGRLFVASYSDGLFALDPRDGQIIWQKNLPSVTSLAVFEDKVIVGSGDGYLWALRQDDAKLVYRTKLAAGFVSRMQVREGLVVFGGGDSGLVVLDARDGKPLQATSFGARVLSAPTFTDRHVAMVSSTGELYLFSAEQRRRGDR